MRKQTKLVAVLSAAALLAIGASMTSFAAGWQKDDDGTWHYYDSDDEMVTDEWKKDGTKWFYLDEDGDMLTDSWVDDDYYVDESGAMLVNQWKKTLADEDSDDPDDGGEHWYYFGSKGKKVTDQDKKINGKTYFFNEDGEMQYGWYFEGENVYYLGEEDDGARSTNAWLWLELPDEDDDSDDQEHDWHGDIDACDVDCDDEGWYWFGSDGKMYRDATKKKKVNGKYYYFNQHGQMLYEWINTKGSTGNELDGNNVASDSDLASPSVVNSVMDGMRYAEQVEEGWRANGWYEIDGSEDAGKDGDTDWYYIDDGEAKKADVTDRHDQVKINKFATDDGDNVYRARIKVEGKYFCFNEAGQMQTDLQWIDGSLYFFDENGYQKTGRVSNVEEEDDDTYNYYFNTKNGGNGKGYNGEKDGYLYWNGKRLEADDDYKFYRVNNKTYLVNNKGKIQKSSKKYDLEDLNAEDVYVKITKSSYDVQYYNTDGKESESDGKTVKFDAAGIKAAIENEEIAIPSVAIYDNIFAPNKPEVGDFSGKFYDSMDDLESAAGITK